MSYLLCIAYLPSAAAAAETMLGRSVLLVASVECKDCDVLGCNNYIIFGNNRQFLS